MNNTETSPAAVLRQSIAQALSRAGSFCGECGFQPGEDGCPDCRRHWAMCADELLPLINGQVSDALTATMSDIRTDADLRATEGETQLAAYGRELADLVTRNAAFGVR